MQKLVRDINHLYRRETALHQVDFDPAGFEWIDCHNCDESVLGYVRHGRDPHDFLLVACNFTPSPRLNHRMGVPELCWYEEVFNSDSTYYGGSNLGNGSGIVAEEIPWHGRPHSIEIVLPPSGVDGAEAAPLSRRAR